MKTYTFDPTFSKENQTAFPESFQDDSKIAFHGTSCAYSANIESEGFKCGYRPFPLDQFAVVADQLANQHFDLAQRIRMCAQNLVRFSLTKNSFQALEYSLKAKGGQSLGFVREAQRLGANLPLELCELMNRIDSTDVCVYAISLDLIPRASCEESGNNIWVSASIPANALIAKVTVPRLTDFKLLKTESSEDRMQNILNRMWHR